MQRLLNGNTVVAALNQPRAVEVDPDGQVVWDYAATDDLKVMRLYQR